MPTQKAGRAIAAVLVPLSHTAINAPTQNPHKNGLFGGRKKVAISESKGITIKRRIFQKLSMLFIFLLSYAMFVFAKAAVEQEFRWCILPLARKYDSKE